MQGAIVGASGASASAAHNKNIHGSFQHFPSSSHVLDYLSTTTTTTLPTLPTFNSVHLTPYKAACTEVIRTLTLAVESVRALESTNDPRQPLGGRGKKPEEMPRQHSRANRFGALADDGDSTSSQHTAPVEQVTQPKIEAMDVSPNAPAQTQRVGHTYPGTTDDPIPLEETQSGEVSGANYLGSDLDYISVASSPEGEADTRMNTEETREVADEDPLISREEAQLVTTDNVMAFLERKVQLFEQRSMQKKLQNDTEKPTEGRDAVKTMADIQRFEALNLTDHEYRLVVAYRNAGSSVRVSVDRILGLTDSSEPEEGALPSEEEAAAPKPISGKRSHPFKDEAVTKKARVLPVSAAGEAGFDVSQPDVKARRLDPQPSQLNYQASFDFADLVWPQTQSRCIVQINDGILIGDFKTNTHSGIAPRLFLDPARMGSPRISISFDCPGTHGREVATMTWYLDDHVRSEWVVNRFVAKPLSAFSPSDLRIYNPDVMKGFAKDTLENLQYLSLELNPYTNGFFRKDDPNLSKQTAETAALRSMFNGKDRYEVRIWFLTPKAARRHDFEGRCLAVFTDLFAQRQIPLDRAQDRNGVRFKDIPTISKKAPYDGPNPRVPADQTPLAPVSLDPNRNYGAASRSRVDGTGIKPGKINNVKTYAEPVPPFGFQFPVVPPSNSGGKIASTTRPSESSAETDQSPST